MSNKNNVNKGFYTTAGRDRPGEDLVMPRSPTDQEHGWRGGAAPGKARPKAGASGSARGRTQETRTAKRRTTRAAGGAKRRASNRRSRGRRAA